MATPKQLTERQKRNFEAKIDKSGDCHIWTALRSRGGYGQLTLGRGIVTKAHRVAYLLYNGPIPDGAWVLHKCDNPPCCNPDHLWLGDAKDNARDRESKGRGNQPKGVLNGRSTMPWRTARGDRSGARMRPEKLARGEKSPSAKLTDGMVRRIRERYATGAYSFVSLGLEFNVSRTAAGHAATFKSWKHIV